MFLIFKQTLLELELSTYCANKYIPSPCVSLHKSILMQEFETSQC